MTYDGIPTITKEDAPKIFPMRYGVELEYEYERYISFDDLYGKITLKGQSPYRVKGDGSLSTPGGFEVVSRVYDTLEEMNVFMDNVLEVAEEIGADNRSPTAIHIHVSNVQHPEILFPLVERFKMVFEHLRQANKNDLHHSELRTALKGDVEGLMEYEFKYDQLSPEKVAYYKDKKIDPLLIELYGDLAGLYMNGRRTTLRYSGYDSPGRTLEFRIFPQRMDKEIHRIYCQIVEKFIEYSDNHTLNDVFLPTKPLPKMIKEFQVMCKLTDTDMYRLFHRKTSPTFKKVRKDMEFLEIVNLKKEVKKPSVEPLIESPPSYQQNFVEMDDGFGGDVYTFRVVEISGLTAELEISRNGHPVFNRIIIMNTPRGPTRDAEFLQKMYDEGLVATPKPQDATGNIVHFIPFQKCIHLPNGNYAISRSFFRINMRVELTEREEAVLKSRWGIQPPPQVPGEVEFGTVIDQMREALDIPERTRYMSWEGGSNSNSDTGF